MPRLAAILIIGVLLLAAVVFLVSKVSDGLKGRSDTVWKIVLLVAIAGIAFWYFGDGLLVRYLNG
jgi:hypothetical protein